MSHDWRGEIRELVKMFKDSREARKKYPRKDRQRLLRAKILPLAAKVEADGMLGLWGYYIVQETHLSSGTVYRALAALCRDGYLEQIRTDKHPKVRYVLTARGRDYVRDKEYRQ